MSDPQPYIVGWVPRLGLGSWDVRYSPLQPDRDDERASVEVDCIRRRPAIRIDAACPDTQLEREVIHELLHVLMAECEDTFDRALGDLGSEARAFLRGQWERAQEFAIERLTDALLGGSTFADWPLAARVPQENAVWSSAFPGVAA
ncbi:MAG TPA: hypothetical protein VFM38_00445 [Candidatus Limnocylindrales bacterium]|nr:hypothetical protein [Candidatus Limnocylindrales bacterium]